MLFQGKTKPSDSSGDGKHGARYGLITGPGTPSMKISDGTTDPKTTLGDENPAKQCFGYRVFVELKPDTSSDDSGNGEVLV